MTVISGLETSVMSSLCQISHMPSVYLLAYVMCQGCQEGSLSRLQRGKLEEGCLGASQEGCLVAAKRAA